MITTILKNANINLVLVDIGASGEPPTVWQPLGDAAIYIGFDPDEREVMESRSAHFKSHIIINKAVMPTSGEVKLYLTSSPFCSSTLHPLNDDLQPYIFSDLFVVESVATATAITLDEALQSQGINHVDWIKIDSQGIDFQIYKSLSNTLRESLLAIDVEPGLIYAYKDEDLFPDIHRHFIDNGFWLSDLEVRGTTRMNRETLDKTGVNERIVKHHSRMAPTHVEARYLRTIEWLQQNNMPKEKYITLAVFAVMDRHYGYALDILVAYETQFRQDQAYLKVQQYVMNQLKEQAKPSFWTRVKRRIERGLA